MSAYAVARNSIVKMVCLTATVLIEIWYAKFLVTHLGVELYGLMPLATNVIAFAAIVSTISINTIGRFTAMAIHRRDIDAANKSFNVSFFSCLCCCLFLLSPVFGILSWFAPDLFRIPAGAENASRVLFGAVMFSFVITLMASAFSIGTFVHNRLDLNDLINFLKIIISRYCSALLIVFAGYGLYGVSFGLLSASFFMLFAGFYLFKTLLPEIRISIRYWDKTVFRKMNTFLGWAFIRQLSATSLIYLDVIIVNRLYGSAQTGLFAIAVFFSSKLRLLTGTFSSLLNPVIIKRYAENDFDGVLDICCRAMRIIGIVFGFPVGVLCGFYKPIFNIWVGSQYEHLCILAVILTCHISINTSYYPLVTIQNASNRLKIPAMVAAGLVFLYILVAISLGSPSFVFGVNGIALAGAIALTLNNVVFSPYHIGCILKCSPKRIYMAFLPGLIGTFAAFVLSYALSFHQLVYLLPGLLVSISMLALIYAFFAWFFLLPVHERHFLINLLQSRLKSKLRFL